MTEIKSNLYIGEVHYTLIRSDIVEDRTEKIKIESDLSKRELGDKIISKYKEKHKDMVYGTIYLKSALEYMREYLNDYKKINI